MNGHPWNCWQLVPNSASYKVAFWVAITSARRMSELKAPIQRLLIQCSKRTRCSSDHTQLPSQVDWQFNMDLDIFLLEFCPKLHCKKDCSSRIKYCSPDGSASFGFEPGTANVPSAGCREDTGSSWVIHSPCHYWRRRNGESGDRESEAVELRAATMPNHLCCPGLHAMELASNVYAIWRKKYLLTASQALQ
ncbi:uncharacterized protein LOC102455608 isoform X2 [Pelodiscus sinensis]|uniref:uncharacterized protein LOC102455608 isoform X2 n=1 Tax=Pelodiscus sinensis TaxID=13735 RepID=UPI003F6B163D